MRSMLGTGHAMAVQNNLDDVYYNTFFAGGVACGGAQTRQNHPVGDCRPTARQQREAACGTGVRAHARTVGAGLALRTAGGSLPRAMRGGCG